MFEHSGIMFGVVLRGLFSVTDMTIKMTYTYINNNSPNPVDYQKKLSNKFVNEHAQH